MVEVNWVRGALAVLLCVAGASFAQAATINGAGSTFAYPIYAKWADTYKTKTDVGLNYQSIGSGGGIKQIEAKTVDFGATDAPLSVEQLEQNGLAQFPTVMGGVVPVVNLPGIKPGELKLTGKLLADMYLGKITAWNDPAIAAVNPGLKLPDTKISPISRSDGSGTTYIFTHYLAEVSPEWKDKVGNATSVQWPTGLGGKGNEGVASYVQRAPGGIGYVEYAYSLQNKMTYALMQNKVGKFVSPSSASFQAAAANADWSKAPGYNLILTNQDGAKSWPITGATFILMQKKQDKPEVGEAVLKFFDWAYHHGSKEAIEISYVPLPASLVKMIETGWQKDITSVDGKKIWPSK